MFSVCYSGQNQSGESIDQPDSLTNRNQQVNQPREIMLQSFGAKEITQKISKSKCLIANYEKKNLTKLINLFSIMCKFFLLHLNGLTISLTIKYLNWKAEKKQITTNFFIFFCCQSFLVDFEKSSKVTINRIHLQIKINKPMSYVRSCSQALAQKVSRGENSITQGNTKHVYLIFRGLLPKPRSIKSHDALLIYV